MLQRVKRVFKFDSARHGSIQENSSRSQYIILIVLLNPVCDAKAPRRVRKQTCAFSMFIGDRELMRFSWQLEQLLTTRGAYRLAVRKVAAHAVPYRVVVRLTYCSWGKQ